MIHDYYVIKDLFKKARYQYIHVLEKKSRIFKWLDFHKRILNLRNNYINLNDHIYYATFTFKEEKLNDNDFKRKSFVKYLKENHICSYILNKDFGDEHARVHLHGFIYSNSPLKNSDIDLYGFVKIIDLKGHLREEEERITNYITNYVLKNNFFSNKMLTCYFENVYN